MRSSITIGARCTPAEVVEALRQQLHEDELRFLDIDASPVFLGEVRVIVGEP